MKTQQTIRFYAVEIAGELDTWAANINPSGCNTKVIEGNVIDFNSIGVQVSFSNTTQWVLLKNVIA